MGRSPTLSVIEPDEGEVRVSVRGEPARSLAGLKRKEADHYRLRVAGFVLQRPRLIAHMSAIHNAALRRMSC
ncbi:MAG TPA: hypothetical protein VFG31_07410, partial [Conexibacter sp.]|nr:hypothetical protein [Conexibacter sp.]